ncbi:MarR family winged helix-turn-helix transcriptional regulator [Spirosoma sp. KCTC 42546]|uniref:MarR family winged helix-turn-helix transcriptional regulator n=1 Tax=Spirosoma sp. KCTC 42546 TaxID=2520506 RepID=UPI00143E02A5|nr:MarR family winged helix-turn-helix transcriptional regulator [Spirosoma sp. KCTC 42546]
MNKTVELINLWAKYEEENPKAELSQFCQDYLVNQEQKTKKVTFWQSPVPPDSASILTKLVGRIARLHNLYVMGAFKDCGISTFDEFLYLNSIANTSTPKKTDVILANFNELSSGLLILDRLKKAELIVEQGDKLDKRTKRLELTKEGASVLAACYQKLSEVNEMCFGGLAEEQVQLCIQLLQPVEASLAKQWLEDKKK